MRRAQPLVLTALTPAASVQSSSIPSRALPAAPTAGPCSRPHGAFGVGRGELGKKQPSSSPSLPQAHLPRGSVPAQLSRRLHLLPCSPWLALDSARKFPSAISLPVSISALELLGWPRPRLLLLQFIGLCNVVVLAVPSSSLAVVLLHGHGLHRLCVQQACPTLAPLRA
jgi:hypothetical protein